MNIYDDFKNRGLIKDETGEELRLHLSTGSRTAYCGFDPTASSLHVGSLVPLIALRRFQEFGHKAIVLIGGATGLIGDPSGKSSERTLLPDSIVVEWREALKKQVGTIVEIDRQGKKGVLVDNYDWFEQMGAVEFLRDIGKYFSVNRMLTNTSVKRRIERDEDGISYTEFSYTLLQSYDACALRQRHGCTVQIGGSDQWGNITNGIELGKRYGHSDMFGLTLPLVTKSDGGKFGKTESGNIWLSAEKTSKYDFYQFWINIADDDVEQYLKFFTLLSVEKISNVIELHTSSPEKRLAQKMLAYEVTALVHGLKSAQDSENLSIKLYSDNEEKTISEGDFKDLLASDIPVIRVSRNTISIIDCLLKLPSIKSKSEARRLIDGGGIRINGKKVVKGCEDINPDEAMYGKYFLVKKGKKEFVIVVLELN